MRSILAFLPCLALAQHEIWIIPQFPDLALGKMREPFS